MSKVVVEDIQKAGTKLVGRSPTSMRKSGRLGDIAIPRFVPLQEFCSPIRLQHLSISFQMLQSDWTTLKCCNLIGLQNSCSGYKSRYSDVTQPLTSRFSAWRLGSTQLVQNFEVSKSNCTSKTKLYLKNLANLNPRKHGFVSICACFST